MRALVVGAGTVARAIGTRLTHDGYVVDSINPIGVATRDLATEAFARVGPLDTHIQCVDPEPAMALSGLSDSAWEHTVEDRLAAAFRCLQLGAARLREGGNVVLVGCADALGAEAASVGEAAAQAAVIGLMRALALDLGRLDIRVNLVERPAGRAHGVLPHAPSAEDIAAAVAYFSSRDAAAVTGQYILVDGGQSLNRHKF